MEKLWAKRFDEKIKNKEELYLVPHLKAVELAGKKLSQSIGKNVLHSVGLESVVWQERLNIILPLSCLLHDLGKANDWFQKMITNNIRERQPIRHEFLSIILILRSEKKLRNFILKRISSLGSKFTEPLINSIYSGILAHHLKFDRELKKACLGMFGDGGYPTELIAYTNHSDFDSLFGEDKPNNDFFFSFLPNHKNIKYKYILDYIEKFQEISDEWESFLKQNSDWLIFSTILKPLVICADVIASALVPEGIKYEDWIGKSLNNFIQKNDLEKIIQERLNGLSPREFQKKISDSKERVTLVEAGCGSGKTIGAYLWALSNAENHKLYFCYPTTRTATEGYLGYVNHAGYEAELIHSRSDVDLDGIQNTGDDEDNSVISDKIHALTTYHPKIIICTIDTVLSLMKNGRKSILSFPSIATGIFVFDEIHSFNDEMFQVMVSFINLFKNIKFLLMSASLQPERKDLLKREFTTLTEIESPRDLMELKRYKFNSKRDSLSLIEDAKLHADDKKILIVVNTVGRAQAISRELNASGYNVKIYHSRYKYIDRVNRHKEFIEAFKDSAPSVIGIATQVAEMSLDIDSDILLIELAPIPSLIQRLGRLNRRTSPEKPIASRDVFFYELADPIRAINKPYSKEELELGRKWIQKLVSINEISQNDLQNSFLGLNSSEEGLDLAPYYDFTKPNFFFIPATEGLRGASNTINCIIQSDIELITNRKEKLENLIIPMTMNNKLDMNTLNLYKHAFIIPNKLIEYDSIEGAEWQN
ncbi:MAG: CRISPR-associated helicase Cas3' [Leptospiraceae bacterium]|nr:CRISPR-associated helicase Cas3' [Leptospiraceae bacterium]